MSLSKEQKNTLANEMAQWIAAGIYKDPNQLADAIEFVRSITGKTIKPGTILEKLSNENSPLDPHFVALPIPRQPTKIVGNYSHAPTLNGKATKKGGHGGFDHNH